MKIFDKLKQLTELFDSFIAARDVIVEKDMSLRDYYRNECEEICTRVTEIYDNEVRQTVDRKEYTDSRLAGDLSLTERYTDMIKGSHWKKQQGRYYARATNIPADIRSVDTDYLLEYIRNNMEEIRTEADKLNNAFVPPAFSGFIGFFNKNYRKKSFRQVARAKEKIIRAAEMIYRSDNTESVLFRLEREKNELLDIAFRQYKEKVAPLSDELIIALNENETNLNTGVEMFNDMDLFGENNLYLGDYSYSDSNLTNSLYDENLFIVDREEVRFPVYCKVFDKNIMFETDNNTDLNICFTSFVSDILYSDSQSRVYVADIEGIGGNYLYLAPLLDSGRVEIWKNEGEVSRGLDKIAGYIADINSGKVGLEKKKIYIFVDKRDKNITGSCLEKLRRIVVNGNRARVYTILSKDREAELKRDGDKLNKEISDCSFTVTLSGYDFSFGRKGRLILPMTVDSRKIEKIYRHSISDKEKKSVIKIDSYLPSAECFQKGDSSDGLSLHIGTDENSNDVYLNINEEKPYGLITGDVDTGKSSVLHGIILQALLNYPPNQLQVAVGDFKEGAEFNIYAKKGVSSVQAVVNNKDIDVMASFLNFYLKEADRRQRVFEDMSERTGRLVRKYETYRQMQKQYDGEAMPRILLIIDEYQSLFNNSPMTAELMSLLVRNGRTYGIHIVMASQRAVSDSAKNYFTNDLKNYFTHRFVFRSPRQAAGAMLSAHCSDTGRENTGIAKASSLQKGQAVYNGYMGQNEKDNLVLQCFYADDRVIEAACELMNEVNDRQNGLLLRKNEPSPMKNLSAANKLEIGVSPCMYKDFMTESRDIVSDMGEVSIQPFNENILVTGRDTRLMLSIINSAGGYISMKGRGEMKIFRSGNSLSAGQLPGVNFLCTKEEQIQALEFRLENGTGDIFVFPDIDGDYLSERTSSGQLLIKVMESKNALSVIGCANYRKLRSTNIPSLAAIHITGVGDTDNVRQCLGDNARFTPSDYDVPNKKSIKAYYCNKHTDKSGKVILYSAKKDFL